MRGTPANLPFDEHYKAWEIMRRSGYVLLHARCVHFVAECTVHWGG